MFGKIEQKFYDKLFQNGIIIHFEKPLFKNYKDFCNWIYDELKMNQFERAECWAETIIFDIWEDVKESGILESYN